MEDRFKDTRLATFPSLKFLSMPSYASKKEDQKKKQIN